MKAIETLEKADMMLTELYWQWIDNREDPRHSHRLDTILGKIRDLKELIEED